MNAKGTAHKYGDHVDTDVIIPARYLATQDPKELASHCMEDIDKSFIQKVKPGDIMVAGVNFGCGSSREHAPIAIKASGVACVIAASFARIFYRNAINIGLAILECPAASAAIADGDPVRVDFDTGVITDEATGEEFQAEPFPPFIKDMIAEGGLMASLKAEEERRKKNKTIAVIRGDGIGPEIVAEALGVLDAVAQKFGHTFTYVDAPMGGNAIDLSGVPLPEESLQTCLTADSVLLGAVGGPRWDDQPPENRPERGLLRLREAMALYTNVRPAKVFPVLSAACPLRPDIAAKGIDFVVVRELIGGVYFGNHLTEERDGELYATDLMAYSEHEIRRITRIAFEMARTRRKRVTSVDKANVLDTSRLWRKIVTEVAKEYPDVELLHMYVDNAAMQMVRDPSQFDVIVTENLFGDILSDEASQITGSIGMIPSFSMGDGKRGLFEPIHGSAPDIAGQDRANPIGTILSAAMMLRYSFGMEREADAVEQAVDAVLREGWRCADIARNGEKTIGCIEMGERIRAQIESLEVE